MICYYLLLCKKQACIMKLIFLLLPGNALPLYSADIVYISDDKKEIRETISSTSNGMFYNFESDKKLSQIIMSTNENLATLSFTNITKKGTNAFYLLGGNLVTIQKGEKKIIELQNLEIILLPEIQLQNFIKNTNLTTIRYVTIKASASKTYTVQADKVLHKTTNINNVPHSIVNIHYDGISPKKMRFVYYFDTNSIASKKEMHFLGTKKPQLSFIKQ